MQAMNAQNYEQASEYVKVLAHPMRLRIIDLLSLGPLNLGSLSESLDLKSHVTSELLRLI